MTINKFWAIIEKGNMTGNNYEDFEKTIDTQLKQLSTVELVGYQEILHRLHDNAYRWDLWLAAYIIEDGGCGDDNFMDFRAGLVSLGREIYENTLTNPDSFALLDENRVSARIYGESFIGLATKIYEERTSNYIYDAFDYNAEVTEPTGQKVDFEDEKKLREKYPNLIKKYWLAC